MNVIPIIGKADCLTKDEKEKLKKRILDQLNHHQITVYTLPDIDDEDPSYLRQINEIKNAIPFAICSSTDKVEVVSIAFESCPLTVARLNWMTSCHHLTCLTNCLTN